MNSTRRHWLSTCTALVAWPEALSAVQHPHTPKESSTTHFETLDPTTAGEIEAIAAQIIPSTDGPGAHEAGVIYFIDRALATFAADDRERYRTGMARAAAKTPGVVSRLDGNCVRSAANSRLILIHAIETSGFFELLRTHTVFGFLGDPELWRQSRQSGMDADRLRRSHGVPASHSAITTQKKGEDWRRQMSGATFSHYGRCRFSGDRRGRGRRRDGQGAVHCGLSRSGAGAGSLPARERLYAR